MCSEGKSLKKEVGSGVRSGSGSISQRYGSPDPGSHRNVTDTQHWFLAVLRLVQHLTVLDTFIRDHVSRRTTDPLVIMTFVFAGASERVEGQQRIRAGVQVL
jgi:hypothetical protein